MCQGLLVGRLASLANYDYTVSVSTIVLSVIIIGTVDLENLSFSFNMQFICNVADCKNLIRKVAFSSLIRVF